MSACKHCNRCKSGCDFCSCCGKCQRCDNQRHVAPPAVNPPTWIPFPVPAPAPPVITPWGPDVIWGQPNSTIIMGGPGRPDGIYAHNTGCGGGLFQGSVFVATIGGLS